jgi:hypothetical protein
LWTIPLSAVITRREALPIVFVPGQGAVAGAHYSTCVTFRFIEYERRCLFLWGLFNPERFIIKLLQADDIVFNNFEIRTYIKISGENL